MKAFVYKLTTHPGYAKVFHWGKLISITGAAQITVQLVGLTCGILIIRFLSPNEYALYTLANMMFSTITVLAECDIATAVMAQGGKVWRDPKKLGVVLATGFGIRRILGICSILIVTPLLLYLLRHHGASWITSLLIIFSIIPAFFASLSDTLLEVPSKLTQDIAPLQKNQVQAGIARLLLTVITISIFPWAFIAILASGFSRMWANIGLRKISTAYVDWSQKGDAKIRKEILTFVKRILPMAIYYSFSGQITIWIISFFGSTSSIAEIGALGRLTAVIGFFSVLFGTLIAPRFARIVDSKQLLLSRYLQILFGLLLAFIGIVGLVWFFSAEVLWILGKNYYNLHFELLLSIIGSSLGLIAGSFYALNSSRGWIMNPVISVPINIASIILGVLLLNVSTLQGVLIFNIAIASVYMLMNGLYGFIRIKQVFSVPIE